MQRLPTRSIPAREHEGAKEPSALMLLARKIREEQGPEQVKDFLNAMRPFAAPGELKRAAENFGIEIELYDNFRDRGQANAGRKDNMGNDNDKMKMLNTLFQLRGLMQGGSIDPVKLMSLLGG